MRREDPRFFRHGSEPLKARGRNFRRGRRSYRRRVIDNRYARGKKRRGQALFSELSLFSRIDPHVIQA